MKTTTLVIFMVMVSFLFRIFLIPVARHGDINNNTSWGKLLVERGPVNFYEGQNWPNSAPNQPPLYLLLFGSTKVIEESAFNLIKLANKNVSVFPSKIVWWFDRWGELYIAKLPGIFADLCIGLIIYLLIKGKRGLLLSALWLINPVVWYNSAIWGGTDSIVNLFGLISLVALYSKKLRFSAVFLCLSVLFKGSLLLFIPLWLIVALKQKHSSKEWLKAILLSLVCFLLITYPFHPNIDIFVWFYNLYTKVFIPGEIGTLTANAFNVWWLVDPLNVLDNTLYAGIQARTLGILATILFAIPIVLKTLKTQTKIQQLLYFALMSFIIFLFMTRVHERYLYPFFPLATISISFYPYLVFPYIVLSLVHFLNLYNLFWAPGILILKNLYTHPQFAQALSIMSILLFVFVYIKSVGAFTKSRGK